MSDERMTRLEEQIAHQTALIDDLNAIVTSQADQIDLLTRRVAMLMQRAAEAELASDGTAALADQKPPHY